ncbi:PIG-L family deacetylase [Luteipulveratus sp. YIM 133132]|uniref:PIG-L deacetylase family protein n=1 Tax=Luteipulveratus flavus TaxID=3031728 RepID=UPI0023B0CDB5|nr:PIG-L deacetylase family protein [Luteipulveratus sp. YIM 133132]MDE9364310.1 PIG-L family deacetylase [Luteipulveratus sp. YIM 133132]
MLALDLGAVRHVVCLGAHPDDIEIGCGATVLMLADDVRRVVRNVVLTGSEERAREAEHAAKLFGATGGVQCLDLPDGRLPAHWDATKEALEDVARAGDADLVLAPSPEDAHQDHRLIGELATTVWRDSLVLHYEIPKWDGDLGRPTHYVPVDDATAQRKIDGLFQAYPSQHGRDWWDEEMFRGLMRLRGMECRARYAEAFVVRKALLSL